MSKSNNGFISTLSTRLSFALIIIVIGVGIGVFVTSQTGMRSYYEELNQKLNSSIAMYVTGEYKLMLDEQGEPDRDVLKSIAETAMIINPAIEVYMLDTGGNIIAHSFPEETILQQKIPLEPIKSFIEGEVNYPFRNIDPRLNGASKVFSAAEIKNEEELQGYLYVVLGGEVYDNIEDGLENSYSRSLVLSSILLILTAAVVTGVLIFNLLVRPLAKLGQRMQNFSDGELGLSALGENGLNVTKTEVTHSQVTISKEATSKGAIAKVTMPNDEVELLTQKFNQMSSKIKQQFNLLREADEVKRELFSNISHDLRTPLASIQGYLETLLIKNASLSEVDRLGYLNTAMKSSRRLSSLVGELFELSKLESNQTHLNTELFSLAELVYDTVQEFTLEFEEKKIEVEVVSDNKGSQVFADISLIQRVFENLIRNAIAYTPENGKVKLQIEEAKSGAHNSLKISISDTGHGISAEDLPHIFDRFYSNPDRSRKGEVSTGLGLAIVKRILDLHRADISVDSKLNQGTRFEFLLPVKAA